MSVTPGRIRVEVAYALPQRQTVRELALPQGSTADEAVRSSGLLEEFPEIDRSRVRVAIYGKAVPGETRLRDGDRVEILRGLLADPKEVRRARAGKKRSAR